MTVWKRVADVTYPLPIVPYAVQLNGVGNVSPRLSSEKVPTHVYLDSYAAVFPGPAQGRHDTIQNHGVQESDYGSDIPMTSFGNEDEDPGYIRLSELILSVFVHMLDDEIGNVTNPLLTRFGFYLMPWLFQPQAALNTGSAMVTVRVCKTVYRIQLPAHAFYLFVVFAGVTLAWCVYRTSEILWIPMPKLSVFGEVEVTKLLMQPPAGGNTVNGEEGDMLTDTDLREIVQKGDRW